MGVAVSIIIHRASSHVALHLGAHCPAGLRQAGPFNRHSRGSERGCTLHVTSSLRRLFRLFPICSYYQQGTPLASKTVGLTPPHSSYFQTETKTRDSLPPSILKGPFQKRVCWGGGPPTPSWLQQIIENTRPTITVQSLFASTLY